MATIKIKFKDTITNYKNVDVAIDFKCLNKNYTRIAYMAQSFGSATINLLNYYYGNGALDYDNAYTDSNNTWTVGFNVIEIDPTQTNFNAFINAMKNNIVGVELEAGTYKWKDTLTKFPSTDKLTFPFQYTCDGLTYSYMYAQGSGGTYLWYGSKLVYQYDSLTENLWADNKYKIITISLNQYVKYDFYNYAILGNQLVKQGGGTNKLKFGTETPTKLYMGETEVTKAYMGETLVYEKG